MHVFAQLLVEYWWLQERRLEHSFKRLARRCISVRSVRLLSFGSRTAAIVLLLASVQALALEDVVHCGRSDSAFALDPGITSTLERDVGSTQYYIDQLGLNGRPVGNSLTIHAGEKVGVRGWAIDSFGAALAGGVEVVIDQCEYKVPYYLTRTDVAAALHKSTLTDSGFSGTLPEHSLSAGRHRVSLRILSADRKRYYQTPEFIIIVLPE